VRSPPQNAVHAAAGSRSCGRPFLPMNAEAHKPVTRGPLCVPGAY